MEQKGIEPSNLSVQVRVPSQHGLSPIKKPLTISIVRGLKFNKLNSQYIKISGKRAAIDIYPNRIDSLTTRVYDSLAFHLLIFILL